MCRYYNVRLISQCEHDYAEPPRDREAANFCQYFRPDPNAYHGHDNTIEKKARSQLDALFGQSENEMLDEAMESEAGSENKTDKTVHALSELDKLFKK